MANMIVTENSPQGQTQMDKAALSLLLCYLPGGK